MLDAGHGGTASGTVHEDPTVKVIEKNLNLKIALYARRYIQQYYPDEIITYMIRLHDDSGETRDEAEIEQIRERRKVDKNKNRV